jgi:hypothetical protein
MKYLLLVLIFMSCTQKYQTFHVIDKENFRKESPEVPITKKMLPGKKRHAEFCAGQFFFSSNAKKKTDQYLPHLVGRLCSGSKYLVNSRLTETWWTTIIYSRSCVELDTYCPRK